MNINPPPIPSDEDRAIMRALIEQVSAAVPSGGTEQNVTTRISLPMWNAFCRATGMPENSVPTEWQGIHATRRVYGSRTIIIGSDEYFATSSPTAPQ